MKINVTQEHIDKGLPGFPTSCAIAKALLEQFNKKRGHIVVTDRFITMPQSGGPTYFLSDLPDGKKIHDFIHAFDTDKSIVSPFSFELPESIPFK